MKKFRILFLIIVFTCSVSARAQSVYITKTGEKYHKETCHYLRYSKIEIPVEKAIELRYDGCLVCKPIKNPKASSKKSTTHIAPSSSRRVVRSASIKSDSVQCSGTTKSGSRCKRKTTNTSGRCYQH